MTDAPTPSRPERRTPHSTYRLQISPDFTLHDAARVLPYLHDLGVDWVYLSPLLASEPGSTHGYDVVAFDHVDPERGGAEGLAALSAEARRLGMGVLVDIVPNHVGVATPAEGPWWWDVLRLGRGSEYASAFDVDWAAGDGRILIPVVGDDDEDAIHLAVSEAGEGEVRYHDHRFPLAPGTSTLEEQHYELVSWRAADDDLNYRRFFAVNTLAAVRVEDPEVFAETHAEVKRWFDEGLVDGLRVDHPDGLRDPKRYLDDLAALTGGAYVLVEKILEPGEHLPADWATAGTTGYDALALIDRLLTDPAGEAPLTALEDRLRGTSVDWAQMVHDNKRAVADGILRAEVLRITREVERVLESREEQAGPGADSDSVADAVAELLACFPVYRSYLPEGREHLDQAFAAARAHRPDLAATYDVLEPLLNDEWGQPARRFQQTSGMVMAKGVEDCSFYRWSRLTSLNEVGGDPSIFSVGVEEWHDAMAARQRDWPDAMVTLSTHDTKRGEDVRARITVLAEEPGHWERALDELLRLAPVPDPGFGSLLWQAVLGAAWTWETPDHLPDLRERLHGYAEKAMREAGDRTTWTEPDEAYEKQVHAAVDAIFDSEEVRAVLLDLAARIDAPAQANSLSAKLLAITMPGVPDVYQGSELWETSLVDPDNRRRVDFDHRVAVLAGTAEDDAATKLHVTCTALTLRRDRPELFTGYAPVGATGAAADHVVAYDRGGAIAVATRLPVGLAAAGGWGDTVLELPDGRWHDVLTGLDADGRLADLLAVHPVALLVKVG
ncbi:malto-oligosyltrehalose synthase [Nocardioides sp. zg-1228]|uniref:malto-oligosyltrehalose synthase n=1 Tax=Nocardioides sp. zg-1228 TaxID=2763008 RepID=UPI001642A632|nr:malto-oligosyltrehalose synthase [Nocardioides sp. zg-1228]MBC2933061.1 malto-oligosyltrehalose synthase [Nocardioides sp. zg-1228]QSF56748.1 malto-oligosyltrehalose synthase [Nocardioides sp. zg-1228]